MDNNKFHIAYSIDNQDVAQNIDNHFSRVGVELDHIMVGHDLTEGPLRERLKDLPNFILLLVSDNFLKNPNCMSRSLFMIQELTLNSRVRPIIIDGQHYNLETQQFDKVPTAFDRMTNVIKYMNFWQDKYLDLRKARRQVSEEKLEKFDESLKVVRSISSEIGEFLKVLKNNEYWPYDQFANNDFELFFQAMNKQGLHDALKQAILKGEIPPPPAPIVPTNIDQKIEAIEIKEEPVDVIENKEETAVNELLETPKTEDPILNQLLKNTPVGEDISEPELDFSKSSLEKKEILPQEDIPSFTPEITPNNDEELLKISEDKLKKKGKTPLLDKLIQHRQQSNFQTEENTSNTNLNPTTPADSINEEAVEEPQKEVINQVIESKQEEEIEQEPNPKIVVNTDPVLKSIFHDDDAELDSDEMIGEFKLSNDKGKKKEEKDWNPILNQARQLIKQGKLYAGLNIIREVVQHNKNHADLRYEYASYLMENAESYKAAQRELEKVIKLDPNNADAFTRLAMLAERKEDALLAKNYYEKAIEIDSENAHLHYYLGVLISTKFPEFQDQAGALFKKAIKKNGKNADAHYRYGLILDEHYKKPKKAMRHFEITLELEPDHPFVNYDLALMHYRFGAFQRAAAYYETACEINSEFKTIANDRAFLGAVQGDKNKVEPATFEDIFQNIDEATVDQIVTKNLTQKEETPIEFKKEKPQRNANFEKVVFVSGATSGIGKATAKLFASHGFRVIITGRRAKKLAELKSKLEAKYPTEIQTLEFDVRKIDAAQAAIASLDVEWNSIDILINNAGLAKGFEPIHEGKLEDWETMIDTNVKGLLYLTRLIAPGMVARQKGHIINVCSTAGHEAYPNGNVYCATKHAVDALTKGMRLDLYKHGLRVSQVSPAHVEETEFARVRFDWDTERAKIYKDFQPLKSEDVANTIYFIASQPPHVNIQDVLMMGKQQANSSNIDRSGR